MTKYRKIQVVVIPIASIIILYYLLSKITLEKFMFVFTNVKWQLLILAIISSLTVTISRTLRYSIFFPPKKNRWLDLYGMFALMRFLNYLLPFRSGEAVSLGLLKKKNLSPSIAETIPTWIFIRVNDVFILLIWFILVIFLLPIDSNLNSKIEVLKWPMTIFLLLILITLFLGMLALKKFEYLHTNTWLSNRINTFFNGLEKVKNMKKLSLTFAITLFLWGIMITYHTLIQHAFRTPNNISASIIISTTILIIYLLPIHSPLGIGTDEAIWSGILILTGIDTVLSISIALSIRVVSISIIVLEGLTGFLICTEWREKFMSILE